MCLLHSFRNPQHERELGEALRTLAPGIAVSLSSDVMPDLREYERASTAVANAYLQPVVRSYVDRLAEGLRIAGIPAELMLIGSDAGTIGRAAAVRYPVRLVESGPAGGAIAGSFLGARAGVQDLIAFDVGGTTAKVCVIDDGEPERADQFEVARVHRFAQGQRPAPEGAGHRNDRDRRRRGLDRARRRARPAPRGPRERRGESRARVLRAWRRSPDRHRCRFVPRLRRRAFVPRWRDAARPRARRRRDQTACRATARARSHACGLGHSCGGERQHGAGCEGALFGARQGPARLRAARLWGRGPRARGAGRGGARDPAGDVSVARRRDVGARVSRRTGGVRAHARGRRPARRARSRAGQRHRRRARGRGARAGARGRRARRSLQGQA